VDPEELTDAEISTGTIRYTRLVELYILADQLDDQELRNEIIDEIIRLQNDVKNGPGTDLAEIIYTNTPEGSKLRNLLADLYVTSRDGPWFRKHGDMLPHSLLLDMHLRTLEGEFRAPCYRNRCRYHEHDKARPECSCIEGKS